MNDAKRPPGDAPAARGNQLTGAEILVRTLERHGVEVVFTIPGVHTLTLYAALDRSPIRTILPRHEQGAGFMADGYARASGRVGVTVTVTGPGLTNVLTPVAEAFADSSPILVISTCLERPFLGRLEGNLHEMPDQLAVIRPIVKWAYRVMTAAEIAPAVTHAFEQLYDGRPRPVYLEIPLDVLAESAPFVDLPPAEPRPLVPDAGAIDQAAQLIARAHRIFILAGGGAATPAASEALAALAVELGAAVCTTLTGKGAIAEDHPYGIGAFGYRWSPDNPIRDLMERSDLTIAVGTGLGIRTTASGTMPLPQPLIHIDVDPLEFGRRYPPAVAVRADAAAALTALLERVRNGARPHDRWTPEEIAAVREKLAAYAGESSSPALRPWLRALRRALPRDAFTAHDMTTICYEAVQSFPVYGPRRYAFPRGFGTLGSALPIAIGAKIASPNRPAVALCGDGGIQFTIQELATLAHYQLPVVVIVFDDRAHTTVKRAMQRAGIRPRDVDLRNPDFVALARAYHLEAQRVTDPATLEAAVSTAIAGNVPTLIHVELDKA